MDRHPFQNLSSLSLKGEFLFKSTVLAFQFPNLGPKSLRGPFPRFPLGTITGKAPLLAEPVNPPADGIDTDSEFLRRYRCGMSSIQDELCNLCPFFLRVFHICHRDFPFFRQHNAYDNTFLHSCKNNTVHPTIRNRRISIFFIFSLLFNYGIRLYV